MVPTEKSIWYISWFPQRLAHHQLFLEVSVCPQFSLPFPVEPVLLELYLFPGDLSPQHLLPVYSFICLLSIII